jgi:hypothetical protein
VCRVVVQGGAEMIIRKVRGQNKIHPIMMTRSEKETIERMGVSVEEFVEEYLKMIAKERRWHWWFNQEEKNT